VFSDGGCGKDDAGIEGLNILNEAGIAAMAVSVASASIGDGMDIYQHGIISAANRIAEEVGVQHGMTVPQAIHCLTESERSREKETGRSFNHQTSRETRKA
jgi:hypothetical protein